MDKTMVDFITIPNDYWLTIPMAGEVESLNVACAATVVASELMRRTF